MNVESGKGELYTELEGIQHETSLLATSEYFEDSVIQRFHSSSGDKNSKEG